MDINRKSFEIMAPVGSYESLQAALKSGANSIYFGIGDLNMRSRSAANFTKEDLYNIVSICEENGVSSYLTVNTIVYDNESDKLKRLLDSAKDAKVTAVIASDISTILYARSIGLEVHISTQCNISNYDSVKFYAQFADVVVLARELNLQRVREIYDKILEDDLRGPNGELVRIEMFVHGALCMAVSGKCYLSLHEKNVSANRGACNQICRRGYNVKDKDSEIELDIDNEYIMSPKDLCTIGFINKLADAGVRVFKIEGRARAAEYVMTVCKCYDEAIKSYLDGTYSEEKIDDWMQRLSKVFNRGFWNGYYLGQRLGEWSHVYGSKATHKRQYIGKVTNYFSNIGVIECKLESYYLEKGEEVIIVGSSTGVVEFKVEEIRFELKPVDRVEKGALFSMVSPEKVRRGDKVYKLVEIKK